MTEINHPRYGAPLGGAPVTVDGVVFRPYRAGIADNVRCSDDFRITVSSVNRGGFIERRGFYTVAVDGVYLVGADGVRAHRFREREAAMKAGVKAFRAKGAIPHSRL